MQRNRYKTKKKVGDYIGVCDTCNMEFWASKGTVLDKDTGKGGAWVCPNCVDITDYGLIPYQVLPEESVPLARNLNAQFFPPAVDVTEINPMSEDSGIQTDSN